MKKVCLFVLALVCMFLFSLPADAGCGGRFGGGRLRGWSRGDRRHTPVRNVVQRVRDRRSCDAADVEFGPEKIAAPREVLGETRLANLDNGDE